MIWPDHSKLKGQHAFCGASKYSWRNYDADKLIQAKINSYAATIGTLLHKYSEENIKKHFKMTKGDKRGVYRYLVVENDIPEIAIDLDRLFPNLMNYINDAIGFRMDPEITLYYSENFFGTVDAIFLNESDGILRISDLKTGVTEPNFMQLEHYAAFCCLQQKIKPSKINKLEFRFYYNGEIIFANPDPRQVLDPVIDKILEFNTILKDFEGR